jgi:penicillin-binding protein 2
MAKHTFSNASEHASLTRRSLLLGGVSLLGLTTLGARLYYLQFIRAEKYRNLAEGNRIKLHIMAPSRGIILDRLGKPLADNRKNYRLFLDLEKNPNPLAALDQLATFVTIDSDKLAKIRARLKAFSFGAPILIKEDLPWEEVITVEHEAPDLPVVFIEIGERRFYPLAEQAAHILGYVGAVTEAEKGDFYRWADAKIGKQGIEKTLEVDLRGQAGLRHLEVNVRGLTVRELERDPSISGKTIHSSLHLELQKFTYDTLLARESGAAIIMDVNNGEIIAMASAPSFDSNVMSSGISTKAWQALQTNDRNPLLNKATIGQYPPGSTFKMVTGLAGLDHGISPQRRVHCPGHFYLGNKRFNCWKPQGHGSMNIEHAIAESCDTFFYTMGRDVGINAIAETGRKLGLGSVTHVGLPAEKGGLMPDEAWKRKSYNQPWQGGDTINAAIGQGYVLTTPLQLAVMGARLVNGGRAVTPRLTKVESDFTPAPLIGFDPEHLHLIVEGMTSVVNKPFGTAYATRIPEPEWAFGGKTGTAQVRRITIRGQDQSKIPWLHRHHALFVGYAPLVNPRYVVSVIIEHGGGGASVAAPVAGELLRKTQELLAITS